jgi:DNA-binding transcriptional MerR regulator
MARHGAVSTERRLRALELRAAGYSYAEIAQMLGYRNKAGAWKAVQRAIRGIEREATEHLLAIELERLDTAQRAIWDKVLAGDVSAVRALVSIIQTRAKLLGLGTETVRVGLENDDPLREIFAAIAREIEAATVGDAELPPARGAGDDTP